MPAEMREWPSYTYWREPERVKQFWYVSFCLMMSSAQDRLTGLALQESGNLNWATTAFYYSAVHAGRLVCFVCCGDYPTGHAELARLLAPTQSPGGHHPPRRFQFDWLAKFQSYVGENFAPEPVQDTQPLRPNHDALLRAINAISPTVRTDFDRFALLLAKFKNLRNDCNYEALLVAHEVGHTTVTQGFKELVESAKLASHLAVELALDAYLKHLQNAACFCHEREKFHAAHCKYLRDRFQQSLGQKFQQSATAMEELQRIKQRLDWPGEIVADDLEQFLAPIMHHMFREKYGLMARWQNDIEKLQAALPNVTPP